MIASTVINMAHGALLRGRNKGSGYGGSPDDKPKKKFPWGKIALISLIGFMATFIFGLGFGPNSERQTYCGKVIYKHDGSRSGSKGRRYETLYLGMKFDNGVEHAVDVSVTDFYRFDINDRVCWDLRRVDVERGAYKEKADKFQDIYLAISLFFGLILSTSIAFAIVQDLQ